MNGFTRSVTVQAPCCECDGNPCTDVDVNTLIDKIIVALGLHSPGINSDNIKLGDFFTFTRIGTGVNAILRIEGKALTVYGQPCDVSAFPHEYDKMRFSAFVYEGPATTVDFIVSDACNLVATTTLIQASTFAFGTSAEIKQLEKNYYSYQAGYLKHLFTKAGWNGNFESWVTDGTAYDTYYIRFNEYDKAEYNWGDYIHEDATVIIAVPTGSAFGIAIEAVLVAALGAVSSDVECVTTTSTTAGPTTTTTSTTAGQ
jgi:hypothetical protein